MNRQDFLLEIQELFGDLSTGLIGGYRAVLTDPDGTEINYSELYRLLVSEYKFRTAPMPAWFAERLTRVKKYNGRQASLIDQQLREGTAKIISYDPDKNECKVQTPIGVYGFTPKI